MHTESVDALWAVAAFIALGLLLFGALRLWWAQRAKQRLAHKRAAALARQAAASLAPATRPHVEPPPAAVPGAPSAVPKASEPAAPPLSTPKAPAEKDDVLARGLSRSRESLWGRMAQVLGRAQTLDDSVFDELEEVLLLADVGVTMSLRLIDALRGSAKKEAPDAEAVRALLRSQLLDVLRAADAARPLVPAGAPRPRAILFVGVNGVGKTTSVGKLAHALTAEGHKVVLAAGDTFRAAAAEQLVIWGERTGCRVVRGAERADPASVVFNAMQAAQADAADVLLADTAGRLHTHSDLMDEVKKVRRALSRLRPDAPDETFLVVDATTGQNALHQAKEFHQAVGITGIILTKLDGTAKGGIVFAIAQALQVPVRYIGVGEQAEALRPFDAEAFVEALL